MINQITHGDCLEVMKCIPDKSIDMILCDLPYQLTQNKWDILIPLNELWEQYERVIKDNGAIVLMAKQPFTTLLINSNFKLFKYCQVWFKNLKSGHLNAKKRPMASYEDVVLFYKNQPTYNPQMKPREEGKKPAGNKKNTKTTNYGVIKDEYKNDQKERNLLFPDDVIKIDCEPRKNNLHPTQKPVELFKYLIETYSNVGDTVLDNCIGSGTTAAAALSCDRNFIGIEKEWKYVQIARDRLEYVQPVINF